MDDDPVADETEIEFHLQVPVDVVLKDQAFERDGDRLVKAAGSGRTEHVRLCGATVDMREAGVKSPIAPFSR
jgi:hypothetical protein